MQNVALTHSETDTMIPCVEARPKKNKAHVSPLLIVKQRIDEGMKPLELAQDEKYFDIIMNFFLFLEKYTLHVESLRQQYEIHKVLDRVIDNGD
jgi:hypothetical protein